MATRGAEGKTACPSSSLKRDLSVDDLKKAATSQTEGVAPFKNRPFAIFEEALNDTAIFTVAKPSANIRCMASRPTFSFQFLLGVFQFHQGFE